MRIDHARIDKIGLQLLTWAINLILLPQVIIPDILAEFGRLAFRWEPVLAFAAYRIILADILCIGRLP